MTNPRSSPWAATSVQPTRISCPAAQAIKAQRFLSAQAPKLPLPECSCPGSCACTYKKYDDRRAGARREAEDTGIERYFDPSKERRVKPGRRRTDR